MKRINSIRASWLLLSAVATVLLIASCNDSQGQEDTKEIAEEYNDEKFDEKANEKDAQFLVNAAERNLKEIKLGKLAQQKGTSSHVKELGKMMEEGHTKSHKVLIVLAKNKDISIPTSITEDTKDAYSKLDKKSGKDFDKAYAEMMVDGHEDAIESFEKASTDRSDEEIKNWARSSLPTLRSHLDHSIECQKQCDKM